MTRGLFVSEISGNLFDKPASNVRFRRRTTVAAGRHSVTTQGRQIMLKRILGATLMAASLGTASIAADTKPTDPQIAHIAYTAGQIDVTTAEQALKKSKNADVIAFAKTMERDHKAVNDQALALVKKLKVTPEDNAVSQSLSTQATKELTTLEALDGTAFDKAYVENEVAYHKSVNDALANLDPVGSE